MYHHPQWLSVSDYLFPSRQRSTKRHRRTNPSTREVFAFLHRSSPVVSMTFPAVSPSWIRCITIMCRDMIDSLCCSGHKWVQHTSNCERCKRGAAQGKSMSKKGVNRRGTGLPQCGSLDGQADAVSQCPVFGNDRSAGVRSLDSAKQEAMMTLKKAPKFRLLAPKFRWSCALPLGCACGLKKFVRTAQLENHQHIPEPRIDRLHT
jgi:hypothetical protein